MNIKHYILACLSLLVLASCSEKDDTVVEYADWQKKNEQFFEAAYLAADWDFTLRKYSLRDEVATNHTDFVLVEELYSEDDAPEAKPFLNDTVQIHYVGHLIPSPSYSTGFQFDQSYQEPFDMETSVPTKFAVNGLVTGLSTALMNMHKGDVWQVTVPYQLGYGTVDNGNVPAYSTLIFEIRLEEFWTKKKGDRY
ncbi:MAG: FKBP-type peptidyl-prolyl cis-trans isomerase [Prevotella sp.]|nr:FKBP-type peptidyl-prolyl cis-trans isomerase [Prevotella sp.]MBQ8714939.1 FKBP-type peptidyl-prolyl cis-trans isomerase [Prevotella sp.]